MKNLYDGKNDEAELKNSTESMGNNDTEEKNDASNEEINDEGEEEYTIDDDEDEEEEEEDDDDDNDDNDDDQDGFAPSSTSEVNQDTNDLLSNMPNELPILPMEDVVVFPHMILPLVLGKEKSSKALEFATQHSKNYLFIVTERSDQNEGDDSKFLAQVGTIVVVMRTLKFPGGQAKALIHGVIRGKIDEMWESNNTLIGKISPLNDFKVLQTDVEREAMLRYTRELCERTFLNREIPLTDFMNVFTSIKSIGQLADLVASNIRLELDRALDILMCLNPVQRLQLVLENLTREADIAQTQAKIQHTVIDKVDREHRNFYLREQIQAIRKELGDTDEQEISNLKKALDEAHLPSEARKEADKQLQRLEFMRDDSAEAGTIRTYLDWMAELPWDKMSDDNLDISKAKAILEKDHYGLDKIKERILEYLSVKKLNPDSKGSIICFSGPPGVGKTSLGKSIARAMGRKFQRISLGGMRDEAEIRGHRRTYVASMPGRIIQALKLAGTKNPVIVLDELDKMGSDFRGDPSSALLEALDPEQNANFSDHYLNVPFDLSKVLFICTANHPENIPGALKDRLELIYLPGYTLQEKILIAKGFLIPRQKEENGLKDETIRFGEASITKVAEDYTREAGVRELERTIASLFRKLALKKAEGNDGPYNLTPKSINELLGAPKFLKEDKKDELPIGEALGLAWTAAGGEVLHIEAVTMSGTGQLSLTGKLGDVMQESAKTALSYIRSNAKKFDIDPQFYKKIDIHIHVPDGATPKDGPSAGVTLATALISQLTKRKVRGDLCMTGEISLHGQVLPVGGIKEKILAGVALGLKHAFIPLKNTKDLEDIPEDLLKKITIHTATSIDDILDFALSKNLSNKKADKKSKTTGNKKSSKDTQIEKTSEEQITIM